jgi:hypothetical protein
MGRRLALAAAAAAAAAALNFGMNRDYWRG